MGRPNGESQKELLALHSAALAEAKARDRMGYLIPIKAWEAYLARGLRDGGAMITPQACKDKTWWLEAVGLIEWRRKEGIILLEPPLEEVLA